MSGVEALAEKVWVNGLPGFAGSTEYEVVALSAVKEVNSAHAGSILVTVRGVDGEAE
jgi:hypothetical protein